MARFDPRGKVNRALLVGVPKYDFTLPDHPVGVPGDLPGVEHNLDGLEQALREGGVFAEDEIIVSRPRTVDEFDRQLDTAVDAAEGLLLLYFSGHGAVPSTGDELWLLMRRATIVPGAESVFRGAAPWRSVLAVLAGSRAEQVVVILDCCYAGNASAAWDGLGAAQRQRTSLLMGVQANNRVDAGDGRSATPFTAQLVRLLREGLPDGGGPGPVAGSAAGGAPGGGRDAGEGAAASGPADGRDPDEGGAGSAEVGFAGLADGLRAHMTAHHTTLREPPEPWEPQGRAATSGADVLLAARRPPAPRTGRAKAPGAPAVSTRPGAAAAGPGTSAAGHGTSAAGPGAASAGGRWRARALARLAPLTGRRLAAVVGVPAALAGMAAAGLALTSDGDRPHCGPALELRLLTDPDLEPTVRRAAEAYLASPANSTDEGCRRSGITVYSAGAAAAVTAFARQSDPWQRPVGEDNPQRDVGPQPDIWIPATRASVDRARPAPTGRSYVELEADPEPFAYSPVVLAVPQDLAAARLEGRVGRLADLTEALRTRERRAGVRRSDPETTDSALLATVGLYGPKLQDPAGAERGVAQPGPPARTAADLLCALPDDDAVDDRTAALVPEFLLRTGVGCHSTTRAARMAEYPEDVPGLEPVFVRVRWRDADLDGPARDAAVARFHDWLTGGAGASGTPATYGTGSGTASAPAVRDGLAEFGKDGFRSGSGRRLPLDPGSGQGFNGFGALNDPGEPAPRAREAAMTAALTGYREANGPGRVLFLLDSSGSMGDLWEGPGGAPGIVAQALAGLGGGDEYGVWSVATRQGGGPSHTDLLPFGTHPRAAAQRTVRGAALVRDAEADPYGALRDALDAMARRGAGRPRLIVYLTDDEDNDGLTQPGRLDALLGSAREKRIPVVMAALDAGGCDPGRPDAAVAEASGGSCLDTKTDLVARLRDEVARTGTGDGA
ncbi:caspase family protein [Streptomyces sp. NRRL S-87]|uniref:caspase family protein n=1 Tax=Streptomyces sp. NRRL S-87 TaxID=1463920 RepID=UPI00055CE7A2|nr:caspase family protein [Streptomyces sp. NRRL S-87]